MTHDEIANMPAGREMDVQVALMVMGYGRAIAEYSFTSGGKHVAKGQEYICDKDGHPYIPHYSTDIAAAWQVVEKLAKEPYAWYIHSINLSVGLRYSADYWGEPNSPDGEIISYNATAETAPLAICRAALMAVQK